MPVLQGRTREEIEIAIGDNLNAIFVSTTTGTGTDESFFDTTLLGSADNHNGKWASFKSGTNDGQIRRVKDFDGNDELGKVTIFPTGTALGAIAKGVTYHLWEEAYQPERVDRAINQAIVDITGRAFDPVEITSLFFDRITTRFDIPTGISMINRIEYRTIAEKVLDEADSGWTAGSSVTVSSDTELKKRGTGSTKLAIGSVTAGDVIAYKDITEVDITDYTHVEFWARASFTTTAGDYKFLIDDTAASVSPIETLSFPDLTADTWTFVRLALANADDLTAVISIGVEDDVGDNDSQTLWIDDVRVVKDHTTQWWKLFPQHWRIDKEARDLVLTNSGRDLAGYGQMKMSGGDTPVLLDADSTVTEVHASYIIYRASALLMAAQSGGQDTDIDNNAGRSGAWMTLANQQRRRFDVLQDARMVQ